MSKRLTTEEFIRRSHEMHGDIYDYSKVDYIDSKNEVIIVCRKHGAFTQLPFNHLRGAGCPMCHFERLKAAIKKPHLGNRSRVMGVGINDSLSTKDTCYNIWVDMLKRCYSKRVHQRQPTYKDCSVCEEWKTYSHFKAWFEDPKNGYQEGYHLDKDILVQGNKVYSPDTCCFVPQAINELFRSKPRKESIYPLGVVLNRQGKFTSSIGCGGIRKTLGCTFKTAEEAHKAYCEEKKNILENIAKSYYSDGRITKEVYQAIISYVLQK